MIRKNLFSNKVELDSTRKGFGRGLVKAGKAENVWALTADLTGSTCVTDFKNNFPNRFVQVGVAEQNMVTVASGIASMNKVVFATSFAAFSPGRNWEQIRTTICYNNQPVIVVGSHTGLGVGEDGATHQALEDVALMRTLPNMQVIVPCDSIQAEKATIALAIQKKPAYLRLNRQDAPTMTMSSTQFKIGEAQVFMEGSDLVIFSAGPIMYEALRAANELKKKNINVAVINVHTIKPLDEKTILKYAKKCNVFITLEDHQVIGGLGSAISECLAKNYPIRGEFLGVQDSFGESGNANELFWKYGLSHERIMTVANKLLKSKLQSKITTKKEKLNSKTKSKSNLNSRRTNSKTKSINQKIIKKSTSNKNSNTTNNKSKNKTKESNKKIVKQKSKTDSKTSKSQSLSKTKKLIKTTTTSPKTNKKIIQKVLVRN